MTIGHKTQTKETLCLQGLISCVRTYVWLAEVRCHGICPSYALRCAIKWGQTDATRVRRTAKTQYRSLAASFLPVRLFYFSFPLSLSASLSSYSYNYYYSFFFLLFLLLFLLLHFIFLPSRLFILPLPG